MSSIVEKYVEKYGIQQDIDWNDMANIYDASYHLYYSSNRSKEKILPQLENIEKLIQDVKYKLDNKGKISQNLIKAITNIVNKYKTNIEELKPELIIDIPDIKINYKHLTLEYEKPQVILYLQNRSFGFKPSKSKNSRYPNDYNYAQHPHVNGAVCYGSGQPMVNQLRSADRYDIILDNFLLPVLNSINDKSLLTPLEQFFTKAELAPKNACGRCGRVAIIENGRYHGDQIYHQSCYQREFSDVISTVTTLVEEDHPF